MTESDWEKVLGTHMENPEVRELLDAYAELRRTHLAVQRRSAALIDSLNQINLGLMVTDGRRVVWKNVAAGELLGDVHMLEGESWQALLEEPAQSFPTAGSLGQELCALATGVGRGKTKIVAIAPATGQAREADEALLADLFALTPREASVASMMVSGVDSHGIAHSLGVGFETARSHIKHVLKKLDRPRQVEGVVALVSSPAAWGRTA